MAQNITIAGASFTDVPSIVVPKTSSGTATYMDTSDATASASDIASGKTAYVNGELITGEMVTIQEITISTSGDVTQALNAGTIYHFTGDLTSLTVTLTAPSSGLAQYHFDFGCGATAPTVTVPNTVIMPDNNSFKANKHYEVDILNNYGVVVSWTDS